MKRFTAYVTIGALASLALGVSVSGANSSRITKGDAQAVFQAFPGGGSAASEEGAPADGLDDSNGGKGTVIRPFPFFNGNRYCELDWHVALIAFFENGPRQAAAAALAQRTSSFWIDGVPTATERTAVKRSLRDETEVYWVADGVLLAPEDLPPGTHRLRVRTFGPMPSDRTVTFFVDAAGTGACL